MMKFGLPLIVALPACTQASSVSQEGTQGAGANPIRKVVTLLMNLQAKVTAEAKSEQELFDKYMCFCHTGAASLEGSIGASENRIPEIQSAIAEGEAEKAQLAADLASHAADRTEAKATMATATALRAKQAKAFATEKYELETNVAAISKAVTSLERGVGAAFVQTDTAELLRNLFQTQAEVSDADRDSVLAFLANGAGASYVPQSGQITGILKQLSDDMTKSLNDATAEENAAIKSYDALMAAKKRQVDTLRAAIEAKNIRFGEMAVKIVAMKKDLADTEAALGADRNFLANMEKDCSQKEAEWAEISKTRSEELLALADTIKLLNDDEALDLFKRTLPSAASSFVQVEARSARLRSQALTLITDAKMNLPRVERPQLDLIALALSGKKVGFAKVLKMVDAMVEVLATEQQDDDNKLSYCNKEFDASDDKKKALTQAVSDSEAAIAEAEETIGTLTSDIAALRKGIKALDKSVAEATEQRQKENGEFSKLISSNTAAKELIGLAKNRMLKFYNSALYVPPPQRTLSEEDRIAVSMGGTAPPTPAPGGVSGTDITYLAQFDEAPAAPPKSFKAYKKSEESTGVIAMMDLLIKDLDAEIQEAETEEKNAQANYEEMSGDAAAKRAADSSAMNGKEAEKANTEDALQTHQDAKASSTKELLNTLAYISALHAECDWLVKYYETRKEARSSEVDALGRAKAVLSGADYALVQTRSWRLRGTPAASESF